MTGKMDAPIIFDLDHHGHDPQKDILSSLFSSASPGMQQDHMQQQAPPSMSFQPPSGSASGSQSNNPPLSPASSLQNQLNMNMLNNMMQIQSVGESLVGMAGQNSQGAGPSNIQFNAQAMFEQQFKLAQLQQLQQLQNQIFQQQIALISGQSSFLSTSPNRSDILSNALSMVPMKDSNASQTGAVSSYAGLPTPGPSSELRPRDGAMEFVSPMILNTNSFIDSPVSPQSSHSNDHPFSQSHQSTGPQGQPQHYNTAPPQMAFQIQSTLNSHPTSPAFSGDDRPPSSALSSVSVIPPGELNLSPIASPWFGAANHRRQSISHSSTDAGINLRSTTFSHQNNPSSSSRTKRPAGGDMTEHSSTNIDPRDNTFETNEPLRKKHNPSSPSTMRGYDHPQHQQHSQTNQLNIISQPPTSPVTSPTSPFINGLSTMPPSAAPHRRVYKDRISKSVNSTPALRGQRSRVGSINHAQGHTVNTSNSPSGSTGSMQLTLSPHIFAASASRSSKPATLSVSTIETGIPMASFDTPSPVDLDLSMPPPAPPDHFGGNSNSTGSGSGSGSGLGSSPSFGPTLNEMSFSGIHGEPLLPATPASIMNLGRASTSAVGSTKAQSGHSQAIQLPRQQSSDGRSQPSLSNKDRNTEKERSGKTGDREKEATGKSRGNQTGNATSIAVSRPRRANAGGNSGVSPALKAILPANSSDSNTSSLQNTSTLTRIDTQSQQPRKTSHKAAEQKRRDSLKTTFDDLRTLLPLIPLPSEIDESGSGGVIPGIPGAWPPRSSSGLPGSLPPRGPPKTGSEGPNKGVSKLQLLICGNEYIRVLKSRVERRDDEIGRLRREVGKLRTLLKEVKLGEGRNGGDVEMIDVEQGFDLDLDLEGDLDAVELQARDGGGSGVGVGAGTMGVGASVGILGSVGEQPEEEDDND